MLRKTKESVVLAERNPIVVPVGVWVESEHSEQECPEARAFITEELMEEQRQEKEERIRRCRSQAVCRVQQARLREQKLLQPGEATQSQFLAFRRHFMDVEREKVKEHQVLTRHLQRNARIKTGKEQLRKVEEFRIERQQEEQREKADREHRIMEQLRLELEKGALEGERHENRKRTTQSNRSSETNQAVRKDKLLENRVELPPLCFCKDSFCYSHPITCANNCIFYNNPEAYTQALWSVLLNCDFLEDKVPEQRAKPHWRTASACSSNQGHFL